MVATQNIDTLGPIWTFSLRGVLMSVASGLDIKGLKHSNENFLIIYSPRRVIQDLYVFLSSVEK